MDLLKGRNKKQAQDWKERQVDCCSYTNTEYTIRFEDILTSLHFRLANLEQDLNSTSQRQDKQKVVLDILTEIRNTKEEIRRHKMNLQCSKSMSVVRSDKVPAHIADHNVWNDCWYDEKIKVYVTHNEYFKKIPNIHETEHQQKYDKEIADGGIVVREFKVKFLFGYSACKINYKDGSYVWFLLPTMTDDMITKEIVTARLVPEYNDDAIVYETKSEPWLEFGDGLKLTEKEYELGMGLGRYSPIPLDAVKAASNRR